MASYRDHSRHDFRSCQHQRLRNLGHYGRCSKRTTSQPSKMAPFDSKEAMGNERLPPKGPKAANTRSIDENQREGSAIASKPTRGGGASVAASARPPRTQSIHQDQDAKIPCWRLILIKKRRAWKSSRGAKMRPSGPMYGGPNGRL